MSPLNPPRRRALLLIFLLVTMLGFQPLAAHATSDPNPRPPGNGARNQLPSRPDGAPKPPDTNVESAPVRDGKESIPKSTGFLPAARGRGIKGRYIVKLKPTASLQSKGLHAVARELAARHNGKLGHIYAQVLTGFEVELPEARARLIAKDPAVEFVQQELVATATDEVTQRAPQSWGLDRIDQRSLPLSRSYTYDYTRSGRTIYIVDTGIETRHGDLQSDAGTPRTRFGINTIGGPTNSDCHGHGTHVAGVTAGTKSGIAKKESLVSVKVLGCDGYGTGRSVLRGVEWVTTNAARGSIVNMSLTMGERDLALDDAIKDSIAKGLVYIVAAGNHNDDACDYSPSRTEGTITVGATTSADARWVGTDEGSNYGTCVNLFAPGKSIVSADYEQYQPPGFKTLTGTSMAAPHVAGVAAITKLPSDEFTPEKVREKLIADSTKGKITDAGDESPNRLLYAGRESRQACTLRPRSIKSAAQPHALTEKFYNHAHTNEGWTGADSTYSIANVGDRSRLWVFSDTFLPPVRPDDTRPKIARLINNSIVEETSTGVLKTHHGGTKENPLAIMSGSTDDWFWSAAPSKYFTGGKSGLQVIYHRYRRHGPGPWDWGWVGNVVATFGSDLGHPLDVRPIPSSVKVAWGAAIMPSGGDGYAYVYGVEDVHTGPIDNPISVTKYLHIARVLGNDLRSPEWQFLDANGDWMGQESFSAREYIPGTTQHVPISNEFSVSKNGGAHLITQDSTQAFSSEIMFYTGCSVSGPFGGKTKLYHTTEGGPWGDYGNKNLYTYNAKGYEDMFFNDQPNEKTLIVSYNVNSMDWDDPYRNIRFYQPRFFKVTVGAYQ